MSSVVRLVPKASTTAPRGLSKIAREEWDRLAPTLRELGTLTPETEALLRDYVGAVALIAECDRELSKRGTKLTIKGANGVPRPHPLIGARNKASATSLQLARRLGIIGNGAPAAAPTSKGNVGGDDYSDLGI